MLDLKIENGTLVIPGIGLVRAGLGIRHGKIVLIARESMLPPAERVVDATGSHVIPGVIDPHVHLGYYRSLEDECLTESPSALAGGITTVGCHVYPTAVPLEETFLDMAQRASRHLYTDVFFHVILTRPEQLDDIPLYASTLGVTSFKFYTCAVHGDPVAVSDALLFDAFKRIALLDRSAIACVHAQNDSMIAGATRLLFEAKAEKTLVDWANTHPAAAEEEATIRIAFLAGRAGVPLYFVHLTRQVTASRMREIKRQYDRAYAECLSPHLSLTRNNGKGLLAKITPPLQGQEDVDGLWGAVDDDTIDVLATDHSARPKPLLGTHLPVLLTEGYRNRGIDLCRLVDRMTRRPAQLFGLYPRKGTISIGSDADLVLVDLDTEVDVAARNLHSVASFSLHDGRRLIGWPVMTIKSGLVAVQNQELKVGPGIGSYLTRC
ncbi:MAG: amidohydrolase family protein [Chloroflexi bacterium]|nr:amidohydrolase family protein [Chloroflexota bacterium]